MKLKGNDVKLSPIWLLEALVYVWRIYDLIACILDKWSKQDPKESFDDEINELNAIMYSKHYYSYQHWLWHWRYVQVRETMIGIVAVVMAVGMFAGCDIRFVVDSVIDGAYGSSLKIWLNRGPHGSWSRISMPPLRIEPQSGQSLE